MRHECVKSTSQPFLYVRRHRWLTFGLVAFAAVALLRVHFRLAVVTGDSMSQTFHTGDLLLVSRDAYRTANPQRGDVVVACHRKELIVKRVVGLPGEEVELKDGQLQINGTAVPEDYALEQGSLGVEKGRLFEGKFALLGDNRNLPLVQCVHAVVPKEAIVGKVIFSVRWRPQPPGASADQTNHEYLTYARSNPLDSR